MTSSTLLRAAVENDQAAWRNLVESYSGRVYRWIRRSGLQDSDAVDVANQVFTSVARTLSDFQSDRESGAFRRWLRRITQNAVLDWRRVQTRLPCVAAGGSDFNKLLEKKPEIPSASTFSRPLAEPLSREAAAIERVRCQTSPDLWRLFWLVMAEGMSPQDVARECQVKPSAVHLAKHRIAKRIREELERDNE